MTFINDNRFSADPRPPKTRPPPKPNPGERDSPAKGREQDAEGAALVLETAGTAVKEDLRRAGRCAERKGDPA